MVLMKINKFMNWQWFHRNMLIYCSILPN